jgi:flagellar biosynthesis protein FlhG
VRILNQIEDLPADLVLLDLGAGTSYNVLDFFNYSPGKICLLTRQATSLQNVYGFIKSGLYRQISREFAKNSQVLHLLMQTDNKNSEESIESLSDVLLHLRTIDQESYSRLLRLLKDFQIYLVVNMVKGERDFQSALIVEKVCASFLSLKPRVLGHLAHDPAVEAAVNQMIPFPLRHEKSEAAKDLEKIAHNILENCCLPPASEEALTKLANEAKGAGSWSRFWRRAPA